jgi:hypothetical protein
MTSEQMSAKRDKKLQTTFYELAPVWLVNDDYHAHDDTFVFNLIYHHPVHGWIDQHCKYDAATDVLYHIGETRLSEETVLQLQEKEPIVVGIGEASVPNNPANRL